MGWEGEEWAVRAGVCVHSQCAFIWSSLMTALILFSVGLIVIQTIPSFWEGEVLLYPYFWAGSELVVTALFTAEYLIRLWCA